MLPYLGPEIVAVIQAALGSASRDSRRGTSRALPNEEEETIILSLTLTFDGFHSGTRVLSRERAGDSSQISTGQKQKGAHSVSAGYIRR
jgi:hypothetical protein